MSRRHNAQHNRGRSHYPERLADRGLSKSPRMKSLRRLRQAAGVPDSPPAPKVEES